MRINMKPFVIGLILAFTMSGCVALNSVTMPESERIELAKAALDGVIASLNGLQ